MSKDTPPDWAIERAIDLMGRDYATKKGWYSENYISAKRKAIEAFARHIAEHEEDPLLFEARKIASKVLAARGHYSADVAVDGEIDSCDAVQAALLALREARGETK